MNFNFFLKGIQKIIFNPAQHWESMVSEKASAGFIRNSFLFPLILLVSVSAMFGSLLFTNTELDTLYSILTGIKCFILFTITIYATTFILSEITFPLDLGKDFKTSFSLVVFSAAPFILCQILSRLFETLLFVNIIGLYSLYVFWIGAEKLLNPPQYKKMPLLVAVTITFAGIFIVTTMLLNMITDRIYFGFFA